MGVSLALVMTSAKTLVWLYSTIFSACFGFLASRIHTFFVVPAAAGISPPWRNTIIHVVSQQRHLDDLLVNFPAPLLAQCDHVANVYAASAHAGLNRPPFCGVASPRFTGADVALVAGAAALGYREGLETQS
jgi:hypothetical protein